jgi:hypothetical protein
MIEIKKDIKREICITLNADNKNGFFNINCTSLEVDKNYPNRIYLYNDQFLIMAYDKKEYTLKFISSHITSTRIWLDYSLIKK